MQDGETPPVDRLIREERFLHRLLNGQATVKLIQTWETPSGERYTRVTREAWPGL